VVGPEPSKLMARVQIPAGTFSVEQSETKSTTAFWTLSVAYRQRSERAWL